jgi:hypothetical protein
MSTLTSTRSTRLNPRQPMAAAAIGVAAFALSMTAGEVFELNSDGAGGAPVSGGELALYVLIAAAGAAIGVWFGLRGWRGTPDRLAHSSLGLALAAAATYVGFWSGWPSIFGMVALGLALEHRRRVGSFSGGTLTAAIIGALAFVAAAITCVLG